MSIRFAAALVMTGFLVPITLQAQTVSVPWAEAQKELKDTEADLAKGGILTMKDHRESLDKALTDGATAFPLPPAADGTETVLVDGLAENLLVVLAASKNKDKTATAFNPYPRIALYLGIYYDEIGDAESALRALDSGLKLDAFKGTDLGATVPAIYSEQAAAYSKLKRWADSLASCDAGLKIKSLQKSDHARLLRSRGFALVELNRLDEAETSYFESLKIEPENQIALHEMGYINKLRETGNKADPTIVLPPPASKTDSDKPPPKPI
jgi:tetratricopeptide (TPR) repeat protein